jgi:hypothetical protein
VCCDSGWGDSWSYAWRAEKTQAIAQKAKGRLPCGRSPSSHFSKIQIGIQITVDAIPEFSDALSLRPQASSSITALSRKSFQDLYSFRPLNRLSAIEHRFRW